MEKQLDLFGNELQHKQEISNYEKRLTNMIAVLAVIYPLTAAPQLWNIFVHKSVEGVSIASWSMFLFFTIPLLAYCILRKEKKMALMYGIWAVIYVAIISGVFLYS